VPTRSWPSRPASCLASRTARWARSVTRIGRPPRVVCGLRAALVWSAEWLRLLQMVRDQVTLRCARGGHADPNRDHGNRAVVAQAAGCRTTGRRPARRTRGTARRPGRSGSAAAGTRPARRSSAPPSRGDGREAPALSLSLSLSLRITEGAGWAIRIVGPEGRAARHCATRRTVAWAARSVGCHFVMLPVLRLSTTVGCLRGLAGCSAAID
jgi:hypothetical protein